MHPNKKARPVDEDFSVDKEQVYYECIEHLISQRRNVTVGNGKVEHAVYLIAAFLRHAEKIVRIFSGSLKQKTDASPHVDIYADSDVISAATNFLRLPGTALRILVEDQIDVDQGCRPTDHPLIAAVARQQHCGELRGRLTVRQARKDLLAELDADNKRRLWGRHLLLMDEQAARWETHPEKFTADVNFGDKKFAKLLARVFDRVLMVGSRELVSIPATQYSLPRRRGIEEFFRSITRQ